MVIGAISLGTLLLGIAGDEEDPYGLRDRITRYNLLAALGAWKDGLEVLLEDLPPEVAVPVLKAMLLDPVREAKNLDEVIEGVTRWIVGLGIVEQALDLSCAKSGQAPQGFTDLRAWLDARVDAEARPWLQIVANLLPGERPARMTNEVEVPTFGPRPNPEKRFWATGQKKGQEYVQDLSMGAISADIRVISWDNDRVFAIEKDAFIDPYSIAIKYIRLHTIARQQIER